MSRRPVRWSTVVASGETVYGVTTGFGSLADVHLDARRRRAQLQLGLRSHAGGVGRPLSGGRPARCCSSARTSWRSDIPASGRSRRAPDPVPERERPPGRCRSRARSARPATWRRWRTWPCRWSGEGEVSSDGGTRVRRARRSSAAGLEPLTLEAKEGLALINGTQGMLAVGTLAADRARALAGPPTSPPP